MANNNDETVSKLINLLKYFWILIPVTVYGAIVLMAAMVYGYLTPWSMTRAVGDAPASAMDAAVAHVAGDIRPLLEANRSAFAVAGVLQRTSNRAFSQVGPKLFLAFAMQPLLSEMSYTGVDGAAFSYYRDGDGEPRAMFTSWPSGRWYTQAADPATGRLVGAASAAATPDGLRNTTQVLLDARSGRTCASLGAGLRARPGARMLTFSAPVGEAGVVSAAVAVDVVVVRGAGFHDVQMYYSIGGKGSAPTAYELLVGDGCISGYDAEEVMGVFSNDVECTASTIDAPSKLKLHGVMCGYYTIACTNFDVSGVNLGLRLVIGVWNEVEATMFRRMGITMLCFVCSMVAVATVACFLMARTMRLAAAREAALKAELVRQKEALRQTERKSINKSNAFASASHDIRSALSAVAGLVEVSRPEAEANPALADNLNQMHLCTNKLFDILHTILDTSKVESGKMQLEEAEFSLADVLEESVDMANVAIIGRGGAAVEVVWDPCDFSVLRFGAVVGDCRRFKQILDNLLGNAIKFTAQGHVVLRTTATRTIASRSSMAAAAAPSRFGWRRHGAGGFGWLLHRAREDHPAELNARLGSLQNDPDTVEFYCEVVDTGVGIPREKRESVFENYVQVNEGRGGTGLGLGIVQSFVRLMGGEISIKDKEPGEAGTCFAFNVFFKVSERQQQEEVEDDDGDIEQGATNSLSKESGGSDLRASLFREPCCFKGGHCILLVHGAETRRILQKWMDEVGMKVSLVPRPELIASTLEKVHSVGVSPARTPSSSSLPATLQSGGADCDATDRCFSSIERVNQVMPMAGRHGGSMGGQQHRPFSLVIIDVSGERRSDICREVSSIAKMKFLAPCKVVCLADLRTSSQDCARFTAAGCDLVLRKPVHGSRLHALLRAMRDLQATTTPTLQHPSQVGHGNPGIAMKDQATAEVARPPAGPAPAPALKHPYQVGHGSPGIAMEDQATAEVARPPAEPAPAPPQAPETAGDAKPLDGMRVLLVEDTLVLQTIQRKMLSVLGASVEIAGDGSRAVDMFRDGLEHAGAAEDAHAVALPYDVIFMDCQMPVMDGYEATRHIREEEKHHGIRTPIIALTAHSMEEGLQEAIEAGMDLHLTKPIEKKRIAEAVHQVRKYMK